MGLARVEVEEPNQRDVGERSSNLSAQIHLRGTYRKVSYDNIMYLLQSHKRHTRCAMNPLQLKDLEVLNLCENMLSDEPIDGPRTRNLLGLSGHDNDQTNDVL